MSTRKGGVTKGAPKHQNKTAYKHNRASKKTLHILSLPINGLCKSCRDVLEWRKKFRKYKPLTTPKKCVSCEQRAIREAYHVICDDCCRRDNVCSKCLKPRALVEDGGLTHAERQRLEEEERHHIQSLRERERRSYLRNKERGDKNDDNDSDSDSDAESDHEVAPGQRHAAASSDDEDDDEDDYSTEPGTDDEDDDEHHDDSDDESDEGGEGDEEEEIPLPLTNIANISLSN
ncbi:hypothetical protein H696_01708 [Fonticula alba]|uniref:Uncharacterized protein n=1 Tax=Fonticula alba TaxID=691883 RepID=A0A058ZFR1_FONAL|nr:hypothetical protein H696_01708 [Fonticula alba]KCV72312.1 hypothetical protein H696_01708 [Fonticula alba]|eukprot:XP_009493890.1 hypothetical protein H696_01708 [Fonticula alba]